MERTVYTPPERIDRNSSGKVQEEIWGILDSGVTDLLIDMSGVNYLSSAGLRVLVATQKRIGKEGSFALKNVQPSVKEVMDLTGLSSIMPME